MRRYILGGIAIVLIFAIAVYIFFYADFEIIMYRINEYRLERVYGIAEGETLDLELYGIFEVDTSGLRNEIGIVEGTPFTYFYQPHSLDSWKRHGNYGERNFDFSELNFDENYFQDRYLAISFGREIAEIRRVGGLIYGAMLVAVTFAEEYQGDVMFLYLMDEIPFRIHMGHEYFIMDGTERIFIGHSERALNEYIPFP
jgi:hypothetical protein